MYYEVINGKWSHLDGEPLNPIEQSQLSKNIDSLKGIAKITSRDNLTTVYQLIHNKSARVDLMNKISNQCDKTITIISAKL